MSQVQRIVLEATFNAGVRKIRKALIAEYHEHGFAAEIAQLFKRIDRG